MQKEKNEIMEKLENETHKLKAEDLKNLSVDQLYEMASKIKGKTEQTQEILNCDFSYQIFSGYLAGTGFVNWWHYPYEKQEKIEIKKPKKEENTRKMVTINKDIFERWKQFNENQPYMSEVLGLALTRFMDDYDAGKIELYTKY